MKTEKKLKSGVVTSIIGLEEGVKVTVDDTVYTMYDQRLVVKAGDDTKIFDGEQYDDSYNILDERDEDSALTYRQVTEDGTFAINAGDKGIVFGTEEDYDNDKIVAVMTYDAESNSYEIVTEEGYEEKLSAAGINTEELKVTIGDNTEDTALRVPFAATITITPAEVEEADEPEEGEEVTLPVYTINGDAYTPVTAINVTTAGEDNDTVLIQGTVFATDEIKVKDLSEDAEEGATLTITPSGDEEDGVRVVVAEDGSVTEISDLESGVTVDYNGYTYSMIDGNLTKTNNDDATDITVYTDIEDEEAVNILNPEATAIAYVALTENDTTIDLFSGVSKLADVPTVAYGIGATYNPETVVANLTADEDGGDGAYKLEKVAEEAEELPEGLRIVTTDVTDGIAKLTTDFAANVVTQQEGTVEINGAAYKAVESGELTIAADEDGSKLASGSVVIDSTADDNTTSVTPVDGDLITATNGDFTVTVNEDGVTVSGIETTEEGGETFTVGEGDSVQTFTVTEVGLFRTVGDETKLVKEEDTESVVIPVDDDDLKDVIVVDEDKVLTLNGAAGIVTNADFTSKIADVEFDEEFGSYTISSPADDINDLVERIVLAENADGYIATSIITGEITAIVEVTIPEAEAEEGEEGGEAGDEEEVALAVVTINDNLYAAKAGTKFEADVNEGVATFYGGTVVLDSEADDELKSVSDGDKTVTIGDEGKVEVVADSGDINSVSDINIGEKFTVTTTGEDEDGEPTGVTTDYEQTKVGLINTTTGELLADSALEEDDSTYDYSFNEEETWAKVSSEDT